MLAVIVAGLPAILSVLIPHLSLDLGLTTVDATWIGNYSWFLGYLVFTQLERRRPMIGNLDVNPGNVRDGVQH